MQVHQAGLVTAFALWHEPYSPALPPGVGSWYWEKSKGLRLTLSIVEYNTVILNYIYILYIYILYTNDGNGRCHKFHTHANPSCSILDMHQWLTRVYYKTGKLAAGREEQGLRNWSCLSVVQFLTGGFLQLFLLWGLLCHSTDGQSGTKDKRWQVQIELELLKLLNLNLKQNGKTKDIVNLNRCRWSSRSFASLCRIPFHLSIQECELTAALPRSTEETCT